MGVLFGILVLGIIGRRILMHTGGGRDSRAWRRCWRPAW